MKKTLISPFLLLLGFGLLAYAYLSENQKPSRQLPYYGNKDAIKGGDTVYHKIPDFKFYNQQGKLVTQKDIEGKIYVTDFFFTTCKSICPIMSDQMENIYKQFKTNEEIRFVSHTVDPEEDSVEVLAAYAALHHADPDRWLFLTGDKKELYDIARIGYLLDASEGDGGPDDFIHTPNFALIDKEKHIRGYYDGTDSLEMKRLISDISVLLESYKIEKASAK
jgi:protein SCO1